MVEVVNRDNKDGVPKNPDMKDYSDEPFFVKKAEKAGEIIKKFGLPKEIEKKK